MAKVGLILWLKFSVNIQLNGRYLCNDLTMTKNMVENSTNLYLFPIVSNFMKKLIVSQSVISIPYRTILRATCFAEILLI